MFVGNDKELPMAAVGGTTSPLVTRFALGSHSCKASPHVRCLREGCQRGFLPVDVAVFDHEVVRTAVNARRQVVQDDKPRRA